MLRYVAISLIAFSLIQCKPDTPDKEPYFEVKFRFSDSAKSVHSAFKRIYGVSNGLINENVIKNDSAIYLPLNLNSQKAIFYFEEINKKDSIILLYEFNLNTNSVEYYPQIKKIKVLTSFKKMKLICKDNSNKCDDAESSFIDY